jgi:outer membrane lipoprotein-sorting protein
VIRQPPPEEAEALVDAEYGFLHRMTGIVGGEPYVVNELLDLRVDAPIDDDMFRVDPASSR